MPDAIIYIDPDQPMNLQNQIRQRLVDGILNGSFAPGMKLPSSRKLARQLDVARNTVVAAYQQLISLGFAGMTAPFILCIWWKKLNSTGGCVFADAKERSAQEADECRR